MRGVGHTSISGAQVEEIVALYLLVLTGTSWPLIGLYIYIYIYNNSCIHIIYNILLHFIFSIIMVIFRLTESVYTIAKFCNRINISLYI